MDAQAQQHAALVLVDTNVHVVAQDSAAYPLAPLHGGGATAYAVSHLTAEQMMTHMDRAGVRQAALVCAVFAHGYDNRYCADCAARYPDRFVSVANIDCLAPDAADRVSYWIQDRGMHAVRFYAGDRVEEPVWLDDPRLVPAWERAARLGVPIDMAVLSQRTIAKLRILLARFPDAPVIVSLLAHPPLDDGPPYAAAGALFSLAAYPNVYPKIGTVNIHAASKGRSTIQALLETLVERFGSRRLIWASYFPASSAQGDDPYAGVVDLARSALAGLPTEDQRWILGQTARSLYPTLSDAEGGLGDAS